MSEPAAPRPGRSGPRGPRTLLGRTLVALGALLVACLAVVGLETLAVAQDDEERSRLVRFLERQISTPDRQIRLGAIEGALSSDVRLGSITISDREGVWLRIEGVHLVWDRLALIRGRLDIDLLEARSIEILRPPIAPETDAPVRNLEGERIEFEVPELPVAVSIGRLAVPRVQIAEGVIGPAATLSVDGSIQLAGGNLDTDVTIERLDRPGTLGIDAAFSNETRVLSLDVTLDEPADGVLANAIGIEGRPALTFTIRGEGPLDDFTADIALAADGETLLAGTAALTEPAPGGLRFRLDVAGDLGRLVPDDYATYVAEGSRILVEATRNADGSLDVTSGTITSGAVDVAFTGAFAPDFVPTALALDADLARADGAPLPLPAAGPEATIDAGRLTLRLGGDLGNRWSLSFRMDDLQTPTLRAGRAEISGGGEAVNMSDPGARRVTFDVTGSASGLGSDDPAIAEALGETIAFVADGAWNAGAPVDIAELALDLSRGRAAFAGTIDAERLQGRLTLAAPALAPFASLAGRDLAGSVDLSARGSVGFGNGLFDLTLEGTADDLAVGIPALDGLLAGRGTIAGRAARTGPADFLFEDFAIETSELAVRIDGETGEIADRLTLEAAVRDLSAVSPDLAGRVDLVAHLTGAAWAPEFSIRISSDRIGLEGRALVDPVITLEGEAGGLDAAVPTIRGALAVRGDWQGGPLRLSADIEASEAGRRLSNLDARIANATAAGDLLLRPDGLVEGDLRVDVPDLSEVASLALIAAGGTAEGNVRLFVEDGGQTVVADATARQVVVPGVEVGFADLAMTVRNATGVPALDGTASARAVQAGGFEVKTLELRASPADAGTRVSLQTALGGGDLRASGVFGRAEGGIRVALDQLVVASSAATARLDRPSEIVFGEQGVRIEPLAMTVGNGAIRIEGRVADTTDLDATLRDVPLSIANIVRPDLSVGGTLDGTLSLSGTADALGGTFDVTGSNLTAAPLVAVGLPPIALAAGGDLSGGTVTIDRGLVEVGGGRLAVEGQAGDVLDLSARIETLPLALANAAAPGLELAGNLTGTARVTGSPEAPEATFEIAATDVSAAPLREAGIGPARLTARGRYENATLGLQNLDARIGGGTLTAAGTVGRRLDLTATLDALPLGIADAFAPDIALRGPLSGTLRATGSLADPSATFSLRASPVSAAPLSAAGIGSLTVTADGAYRNETVILQSARVAGGGLDISASGRVPLGGAGIDLSVTGTAPLSIADTFLAARATRLAGSVRADVRVTGTLANPNLAGSIAADGIGVFDPSTNLRLTGGGLRATLSGDRVVIQGFQAQLGDGTIAVDGSIGIDPAAGIPADLRIVLANARYDDGRLIAVTVDGALTVRGPLVTGPALGGTLGIVRAEITVPSRLPGGVALIDVRHVGASKAVIDTLRRAEVGPFADRGGGDGAAPAFDLRLDDLVIDAPARVFIRGRGLDAELGGRIVLSGPISDVRPVGALSLIRGRIDILTQRIVLDRGEVTLEGDLDPALDFLAETRGNNITVFVAVTGQASNPQITLSSVPELPQDEVLAQLIFGRSLSDLSGFQLARLAAAAAELAGGGPTVFDQLRGAIGLDDLDVVETEEGGVAVTAGKYINENIYLGVEAGEQDSAVTLNLDVTRNLTVRGTAGTRQSSVGFYYELDY